MNRHCLNCAFEPDWINNQGKCKYTLLVWGDKSAVLFTKYSDPDEVITAEGNQVVNCTGWQKKD